MNIYDIEKKYIALASEIVEAGGEVTPEQEQALAITLEEIENKGRNYGFIIKSFEYDVETIEVEINRLQAMKASRKKAIDRLKDTLSNAMRIFGVDEIKAPTLKISFRKSESVEIVNDAQIDPKFKIVKTTETISKTLIREAMRRQEPIHGAVLQYNYNIQIK